MMFGHDGFPTIRHIDDVLPALADREACRACRTSYPTAMIVDKIDRSLRGYT
jgi:hypothetical protein